MAQAFPSLRFRGNLRPAQREVVDLARAKLAAGNRQLHIVAPPGSGKTILGLYLWAECVKAPALVLSPNSAIQAQWVARIDQFDFGSVERSEFSSDAQAPGLLTSLTYQAVTLPARGGADLDAQAISLWQERLVEKGQSRDPDESATWIADLRKHNRGYHDERLGAYRKEIRDAIAMGGKAMKTLHASSLATLDRLKQREIGAIILDECHHLLGHWGRVLADVQRYFAHPIIIGLTATPPDRRGKPVEDVKRYDEFFGPIDYEVPVPAVVKDGFLAPYQDLVQLVQPSPAEMTFIANADRQLQELVEELCTAKNGGESLPQWLKRVLTERRLPVGAAADWPMFEKREPIFAHAARHFLKARGLRLPAGVPQPPPLPRDGAAPASDLGAPQARGVDLPILMSVLDRYVRYRLRASDNPADHERAEQVIGRLRMLGVQITETGTQACASPVGRVLMYAGSKAAALAPILKAEHRALGDKIRAVVVTDYERTSAVVEEAGDLLSDEAGGAVAAFRAVLNDPTTDALDPVLVTGSSVLVDDDLAARFLEAANVWLTAQSFDAKLSYTEEQGFKILNGQGADWCPRVYVAMITELFQKGLTKCLVGTRGLLGEGWDANKINVLIDLTTVTTAMSVNQLRGRSFRLDPEDPKKLADNWDVVCIAPEFAKGLDDYHRFLAKHETLFGLTDDGAIEKGVGHVHAAFTQIKPEGIEGSIGVLNAEMLERPARRAAFRDLWRIGEPYRSQPAHALEIRSGAGATMGFPPFTLEKSPWTEKSLTMAIGHAILQSLREAKLIEPTGNLRVGERAGGYVRAFLESANDEDGVLYAEALGEAMGPLEEPRYLVPRYVDAVRETWFSRILPNVFGRFFHRKERTIAMMHAVPSALAKNKELVAIYQKHWNTMVSPGDAIFTQRGDGAEILAKSLRNGQAPQAIVHEKEVFW